MKELLLFRGEKRRVTRALHKCRHSRTRPGLPTSLGQELLENLCRSEDLWESKSLSETTAPREESIKRGSNVRATMIYHRAG